MTAEQTEPEEVVTPKLTGEQLRQHVERLRAEADREADYAWANGIAEVAADAIASGAAKACGGDRDGIPKCTDAVQAACNWRESPGCPRRIVAWEQEQSATRLRARLESARIPVGLLKAVLAPTETESVRLVREWLASGLTTLVLSGGVGIGKSTAAAIAIGLTAGSALYLHATAFDSVKLLDSPDALRIHETQLLVLDDAGLEHASASGWAANKIQGLLCARHDGGLRTIVTCNLSGDRFFEAYGERVKDRVAGSGKFVRAKGTSLRVRK